jgi:hypothetical protein
VYVTEGTPVTLTATAKALSVFGRWSGDTGSGNTVLVLPMGRPYSVQASFDPQLAISVGGPLGGGEVGNVYFDTLRAVGGSGIYAWSLVSGTLPPGLSLKVNGDIAGTPATPGKYVFTLRATSTPQQVLLKDSITITAPTLAVSEVLGQLLNGRSHLLPSDFAYLDFLGNNNGTFDLGDFLAWVRVTGRLPQQQSNRLAPSGTRGGRP